MHFLCLLHQRVVRTLMSCTSMPLCSSWFTTICGETLDSLKTDSLAPLHYYWIQVSENDPRLSIFNKPPGSGIVDHLWRTVTELSSYLWNSCENVTKSKLILLASLEASESEGWGVEARNVILCINLADQEDDRLMSQNIHLVWIWMPGSFICRGSWGKHNKNSI